MSYTICRKFRIDAGHRVYKHEGKCASLHGHSYEFWVYVTSTLDDLGRVTDYSFLKEIVGGWLETAWDHAMILFKDDPIIHHWLPGGDFHGQKYFVLPTNPTAENLAMFLLETTGDFLSRHKPHLKVERVFCFETPNCAAEARW